MPCHVVVDRDGWDVLLTASTVIAAVLALLAIAFTWFLARHASRDAVKDRRERFELQVLLDMSRYLGAHTPGQGREHIRALRVALRGVSGLDVLQTWLDDTSPDPALDIVRVRGELTEAIEARVHPEAGKEPPRTCWGRLRAWLSWTG